MGHLLLLGNNCFPNTIFFFFAQKTLGETIQSCHLIKFTMFILEFNSM